MVSVSNLSHYLAGNSVIIENNFDIPDNQVVGFLGPNGAGKTTTMRIITGYYPIMQGVVKVAGHDIATHSFEARSKLGYLPETVPLYDDLTIFEYLSFMASVMKVKNKDIKDHVNAICKKTGLKDVQNRLIKTVSRGYKQRVGIAQALIGDPQVLILDEPTVGLDPVQIKEIRDLIKSLAASKTVILSTHILPEVSQICSRVIIINQGKIIADGSVDNLIHGQHGNLHIRITYNGDQTIDDVVSRFDCVKIVKGPFGVNDSKELVVEMSKDVRADLLKKLIQKDIHVIQYSSESANLEEIFVRLVTKE